MAEKNKLYITISDNRNGSSSIPNEKTDNEQNKESVIGKYAEHQLFHLVYNSKKS